MLRQIQDRVASLLLADDYFKATTGTGARPALTVLTENKHDLIDSVTLALAKNGSVVVVRSAGGVAHEASTPEVVAITETIEVRGTLNLVTNLSKRTLPDLREAVIRAIHGRPLIEAENEESEHPEWSQDFRFTNHELEELDDHGNAIAVIRFEVETDALPTTANLPE